MVLDDEQRVLLGHASCNVMEPQVSDSCRHPSCQMTKHLYDTKAFVRPTANHLPFHAFANGRQLEAVQMVIATISLQLMAMQI